MNFEKKKKDFKLSAQIVEQFERLAPSGKQTAIVEQLISQWVMERQREERSQHIRSAYERSGAQSGRTSRSTDGKRKASAAKSTSSKSGKARSNSSKSTASKKRRQA